MNSSGVALSTEPAATQVVQGVQSPSARSLLALDALNIFLADIQGGVGPFLVVYLTASLHWGAAAIGTVMFVAGLAGVLAQIPAGALIDGLRPKRMLIAVAAGCIALACLAIVSFSSRPVIMGAQGFIGVAGAVFGPAVAAISLGLVGRARMEGRVGRNQSFNSIGNIGMAIGAGLVGYYLSREAIFYFVAGMSIFTIFSVLLIRESEINHDLARGADVDAASEAGSQTSGALALIQDRRVLVFAVCTVGFHFANASLMTLVTQILSKSHLMRSTTLVTACIIVAQLVIVPVAMLIGRVAQAYPRRPLYLAAFVVLVVRCGLYLLSHHPYYLIALQALDGLAGGIFGVMQLLVVADLTKGTGRFNVTQGALGTAVGIGASLSNLLAGFIVKHASYNAAFGAMALIAAVACAGFYFLMPETKANTTDKSQQVALAPMTS